MATITDNFDEFSEGPSWIRRAIAFVILLAVVGAVAFGVYHFFFAGSSNATPAAVQTQATVTKGSLVTSFATTGSAAANLSTKLSFQGTGQVTEVDVKVGDSVTAGQVLAKLDGTNAKRTLQSAQTSLQTAQLSLQQVLQPPTASDIASAQQAVVSAQAQVATAQAALATLTGPPAASDELAAQNAVSQAQLAIQTANTQVTTSYTSLVAAQASYCTSATTIFVTPCQISDIPLSAQAVNDLTNEIRNPPGTAGQGQAIAAAAQQFMNASNSYINAKNGVLTAQQSLASAQAKLAQLNTPATASAVQAAQANVSAAQANVLAAQAKLDTLNAGPTALTVAQAQQQVASAQNSVANAQDALTQLNLTAPYAGVIGAMNLNVGDPASADSATITAPTGMQVQLTVSETDLPSIKVGQYGVATFDALAGSFYLVKVVTVGTVPTVTQGVVTYPVTAQILRPADLQADAADIQKVQAELFGLLRGGAAAGGFTGGVRAASGTATGQRPTASGTPAAAGSPATGNGQGGGGFLRILGSAPMPDAGMSANVTILEKVVSNSLLVPTGAIKRQGRQTYVVVVNSDGTTKNVDVVVGGSDNTNTAIVSGVTEGEKVLLGAASTAAGAATTTTGAGPARGPFIGGGPGGIR